VDRTHHAVPQGAYGDSSLDSFEKKATTAHDKVVRITDQTRTSVQRLISSLEKQADTFGKTGVDRLISQRDQLLQRYAREDEQAKAQRATQIQGQIQQLQQMLNDAEAATRRTDLHGGKEETDRLRARFFGTHEGMEKAYADAKKDVERLQKELFEPDKPLTRAQAQDLGHQLQSAQTTLGITWSNYLEAWNAGRKACNASS
jgi:hypothetical protein